MKIHAFAVLVAVTGVASESSFQGWCAREQTTSTEQAEDAESNHYDYIVAGAGAGGGVVASRLALAGFRTLLLDAGPDYDTDKTEVPIFWPISTEEPEIEWAFRSTNSPDPGRENVLYPRASAIGGSTMHNAMISLYSFPDFWDGLRVLTGDDEFSEKKMRRRFKRLENNEYRRRGARGHGFSGYIKTSLTDVRLLTNPRFFDFQLVALISGLVLSHLPNNVILVFLTNLLNFPYCLPLILDVNAPGFQDKEGAHISPHAIDPKDGYTRSSVYDFITETRKTTTNLVVKPNSFVTKVLLQNRVAYGVDVQEGEALYGAATGTRVVGSQVTYFARKEVILSGGTFNSPQILMLSGIGPSEELQKFGIPVIVDLPGVGENLDDKLEATQTFKASKEWRTFQQGCTFRDPAPEEDPCYIDYVNEKFPNLYTSGGTVLAIQKKSDPSLEYPDLYIQIGLNSFRGYEDGWVTEALRGPTDILTINISTQRFGPTKGTVKLRSSDPFETVSIDFKGYDEQDLDRVTRGVIKIQDYAEKMRELGFLQGKVYPEESVDTFEEYKTWVRSNGWGHHPLGTCKMGHDRDSMAVVNGQFQVRGVSNLRVVDASVFPEQAGFFPTLPIYMLGEKAAEDITKADLTISRETLGCYE